MGDDLAQGAQNAQGIRSVIMLFIQNIEEALARTSTGRCGELTENADS